MSFSGTNPPSEAGEPYSLPHDRQATADANASFYAGNQQLNSSLYSNPDDQMIDHSRSVSMQDIRGAAYHPSMYYPQQSSAYAYHAQAAQAVAFQKWMSDYQRWWHLMEFQRKERERLAQPESERARMTPLRYPHRHSRVTFGGSGQLLVARGTAIFFQQIDPALLDYNEPVPVTTWPGPLVKGETKVDDVKEYIRVRESYLKTSESYADSNLYEKKLLWNLLSMSVVQTGHVTGSDLAELLVSNNENVFNSEESSDDPMSQLRRYLILGQRKTALDIASKSGLWSHAFALTHFNIPINNRSDAIGAVVSKFTNSTLSPDDPLYLLYRCLLKPPSQPVITENLPQFAILLANDCEVSSSVSDFTRACELLKLMVALKRSSTQHMVEIDASMEYSDERVFINEILEFTRESTEFIEALVPLKLKLIGRLFDFGLFNQASRYCLAIRQYYLYYNHYFAGKHLADSTLDWKRIIDVVTEIECKLFGFDVSEKKPPQELTEECPKSPVQQAHTPSRTNSISRHSDSERPLAPLVESAREDVENCDEVDDEEDIEEEEVDEDTSQQQSLNASTTHPEEDATESEGRSRTASIASLHQDSPINSRKSDFFIPAPMVETTNSQAPLSFVSQATSPVFPPLSSPIPEEEDTLDSPSHSNSINTQLHSTANFSTNSFIDSSQVLSPISSPPYPTSSAAAASGPPSMGLSQPSSSLQANGDSSMKSNFKFPNQNVNPSSPLSSTSMSKNNSSINSSAMGSGWFNSIISKVVPQGPKQAILPDDKNPSIYYDEKLKQWVNKDDPVQNSQAEAIRQGPPKGPIGPPMASSGPGLPPSSPLSSSSLSLQKTPAPPSLTSALPSNGSLPPVPSMTPAASLPNLNHNNFSFIKNNKRRPAYVDAWNQQQQKAS